MQNLISQNLIAAGHDIASGGLITSLLEMYFSDVNLGAEIDLSSINQKDSIKLLFSENSGVIIQTYNDEEIENQLNQAGINYFKIGKVSLSDNLNIINQNDVFNLTVSKQRDVWHKTSFLLDQKTNC